MPRLALGFILLACAAWVSAGDVKPDERIQVRLPPALEARQLAEVLSEQVGIDLQFDPGKLAGAVRLVLPAELTRGQLWTLANQALLASGLTTVAIGNPPQYRLLPVSEAAAQAEIMTPEVLLALSRQPGYATVVLKLEHLAADAAVKALSTLFSNQVCQVRTLGQEPQRLVLSAPVGLITQAQNVLKVLDRPGVAPAVRLFHPLRTAPLTLQAAANAAWTASGRIAGRAAPAEFQVAPDGQQLLVVASAEVADEAVAMAERLDQTEPVEARAYRPAHFGLDEVAALLLQILKDPRQPAAVPEVVRDRLTNRLVVTATAAQHQRIAALLEELEQTPISARRQLRSLPVRHRPVDELARLLGLVLSGGEGAQAAAGANGSAAVGQKTAAPAPTTPASGGAAPEHGTGTEASAVAGDTGVSIATDPPTNHLILLGEPQQLAQVAKLVEQLDVVQPQVELEVILVTLSSSQNRNLGLELIRQFQRNETSATIGSLFGLSGGSGTARTLPAAASGLGALVVRPGDFAGVLRAMETVTGGDSMIRTSVVVANNAKATINGVVQQPLTSINSSQTVATTSVTGTTDAGTQITISPQITAADQVTVNYTIGQSSFIGSSTTTSDGTVIPPPKRSDSLASVTTIPDGHIIALGGLASRSTTTSDSRIPFIGAVPVIGWAFSSTSKEESDSRFYVFIRANVLRQSSFSDLRRISTKRAGEMGVESDWPKVEPQFTP